MINQKAQPINILNNISKHIIQNNIIKKNQFILISISGGQDSICMFFILLQLKKQWGWTFGIVYCNHLWQQNSFYTTSLIIKLGLLFKIPVYITVPITKIFNEKQARYWRYDFFYRLSSFYKYEIIVTGHTYSDKTETILFQLTRGSSTKSLTSLHFIKYFLSNNKFSQYTTFPIKYFSKTHTLKNIKIKKLFNKKYFSHFFFFKMKLLPKKTSKACFQGTFALQSNGKKLCFFKPLPCNARGNEKQQEKSAKFVKFEHVVKTNENSLKKISSVSKHKMRSVITNNTDKIKYSTSDITKLISSRILARPLLSVHRFDLKKLSIFWNLPIYPDKSNQKKNYYRNRIRKQLLPTLRFFFNPQIDNIFFQFSKIASSEQIYLDIVLNRLKLEFLNKNQNIFQINTFLFSYIPLSTQRKLIKYFLENCSKKQIQFEKIESVLETMVKKKFTKETKFYFSFNSLIPTASVLSRINQFSDSEVTYDKKMLPKVLPPKTKYVSLQPKYQSKKDIEKKFRCFRCFATPFGNEVTCRVTWLQRTTQRKNQNKIQIKKKSEQKNTLKNQIFPLSCTLYCLRKQVKLVFKVPLRCKAMEATAFTSKASRRLASLEETKATAFASEANRRLASLEARGQKITILTLSFLNQKRYVYFTKKNLHNICKELLYNQFTFKHSLFKEEFFYFNFVLRWQARGRVKYFLTKKKNIFNFKLYSLLVKFWINEKKQYSLTNYTRQKFSKKTALNICFNQQYFEEFDIYFCSNIGVLFCFKKKIIFKIFNSAY